MALMIESIMYLGIGFLAASISVLAVVPIVHTRAVRLTTRQLADTMPSSAAEIAADKDLLRAEFAMSTRTLEMKVDQLKGKGAILSEKDSDAAQLVGELSERAAFAYAQANEIFTLKGEVDTLTGRLDETHKALRAAEDRGHELTAAMENAARVLSKWESEVTRLTSELNERSMLGQAQTNEIFVIKAEVDTLSGRLNEACAALNAAEDRGQAFAAAAGHAEQALLAKESEIARLIAELDERLTLSEAQTSEMRSLKAEVESITGRLDETSQVLNTAEDGRDALTVAVENAERALTAKESELTRLACELNENSKLSEAQANEILGLKAEVESLTARFDETSKAVNTAEDQRHALTSAAEKAGWALSAKESEVARLIGELNVHSTLSEAQTNEIVSLKAEDRTPRRGWQGTECGQGWPLCAHRCGGERRAGAVRE
jgi:chromosome segregation ATPase